MDRCSKCSRLVDTDYDCGFYPEEGEGMCEPCREAAEEQELQNEFAAFAADYEAEQESAHE